MKTVISLRKVDVSDEIYSALEKASWQEVDESDWTEFYRFAKDFPAFQAGGDLHDRVVKDLKSSMELFSTDKIDVVVTINSIRRSFQL